MPPNANLIACFMFSRSHYEDAEGQGKACRVPVSHLEVLREPRKCHLFDCNSLALGQPFAGTRQIP